MPSCLQGSRFRFTVICKGQMAQYARTHNKTDISRGPSGGRHIQIPWGEGCILKGLTPMPPPPGVMARVSWNLGLESELLIWELGSEIRGLRSGV